MHIGRLIAREAWHRRIGFGLGVLATAVAAGCLTAELALLADHDRRSEALVAAKEAATAARMRALEDDYRRITKDMGFNLLILPAGQDLAEYHAAGCGTATMPEDHAGRLARNKLLTINHVLPALQRKVKWPERERTVLLTGVRGEVFIQNARQKPILDVVPAGTMVVGHELHRSLKLRTGDRVALMGKEFRVGRLHPERGTVDDITIWINLAEAQALLDAPGRISSILALECGCAADRLAGIRTEVGAILPDVQVVEFAGQAIARAETRNRAEAEAKAALQAEKDARQRLRAERAAAAAVLVPTVTGAAAVWLGMLSLANVRERRGELGILRAVGLRTRQVMTLVLGRAAAIGLVGAGIGLAGGLVAAGLLAGAGADVAGDAATTAVGTVRVPPIEPFAGAAILLAAPVLAMAAAWLPALLAVRQDPAESLREL